jgi:hypothetical protein
MTCTIARGSQYKCVNTNAGSRLPPTLTHAHMALKSHTERPSKAVCQPKTGKLDYVSLPRAGLHVVLSPLSMDLNGLKPPTINPGCIGETGGTRLSEAA